MAASESWVANGGAYAYNQWTSVGVGRAGDGCGNNNKWNWIIHASTNYIVAGGRQESGDCTNISYNGEANFTQHYNGSWAVDQWGYAVTGDAGQTTYVQITYNGGGMSGGGGIQLAGINTSSPVVATHGGKWGSNWYGTMACHPSGISVITVGSRSSGHTPYTGYTELFDGGGWTSSPCGVSNQHEMAYRTTYGLTSFTAGHSGVAGLSATSTAVSYRGTGGGGGAYIVMSKRSVPRKLLDFLQDKWRRILDDMLDDPEIGWHNPIAFPKNHEKLNRHTPEWELMWNRLDFAMDTKR